MQYSNAMIWDALQYMTQLPLLTYLNLETSLCVLVNHQEPVNRKNKAPEQNVSF